VDGYGRRKPAGTRKNYCPNNPHYAEYSRTIVERMVLHYKDNPNIVGWQIDNGFEAIKRTSSDREIVFALNHNEKPVQVSCGKMELEDLISGEKVDRMLKIDGFDAKILKRVK